MTFLARHRSVQPNQWEARDVMIECRALAPIDIIVALFTARTELVLVRIFFPVTRDTSRC